MSRKILTVIAVTIFAVVTLVALASSESGVPAEDTTAAAPVDDLKAKAKCAHFTRCGIQKLIDAAAKKKGKHVIQLKKGTYKIGLPIVLRSNIVLKGAGMGKTIIGPTNMKYNMPIIVNAKGMSKATVQDMTLKGNLKTSEQKFSHKCHDGTKAEKKKAKCKKGRFNLVGTYFTDTRKGKAGYGKGYGTNGWKGNAQLMISRLNGWRCTTVPWVVMPRALQGSP